MTDQSSKRGLGTWLLVAYAVVIAVLGAVLAYQGGRLVAVGGSWYYLIAGIALFLAGVLLALGKRAGLWLFGATLAGTIAWALWEVGLDGWGLVPRLAMMSVLGLVLLPFWGGGASSHAAVVRPELCAGDRRAANPGRRADPVAAADAAQCRAGRCLQVAGRQRHGLQPRHRANPTATSRPIMTPATGPPMRVPTCPTTTRPARRSRRTT